MDAKWTPVVILVLLFGFIGLACAEEPSAQDQLLATVKAQTQAARVELEKAKAQAKADAEKTSKLVAETRTTCEQLVTVTEELKKAEAEARVEAAKAQAAQAATNELVIAAKVRMGRPERPSLLEAGSVHLEVDTPEDARARALVVCRKILAKSAPPAEAATK